ncbi:hypothetical protein Raf01_87930 [Rugosimonospora africana]|uniref:Uncharacterized protein n=1 Tax=Rugosimonospora africana TaxID=556532 RepID=A0A8J3VWA2_9ACTN|nr:hypothetical protein Raf01_87930 [Rugosimonospora africana]
MPDRPLPFHRLGGGVPAHVSDVPHSPADRESLVEGRFFRVPDPGLSLTILVADDIKEAIERAGIRGWRFTRAQIAD